jgi:predicted transcriptional regulator
MRLQTSVMVSAELRARVDEIAAREDRSRSWVAERALEAFVEAQAPRPAAQVEAA